MSSSKLIGILAIAATVVFVALVALQVIEFVTYRELWPAS